MTVATVVELGNKRPELPRSGGGVSQQAPLRRSALATALTCPLSANGSWAVRKLRVKQRAYFAVDSLHLAPSVMAEHLGLEPDDSWVRGSMHPERDIPVQNRWAVTNDGPGLTVDEQVADVLARVIPVASRLAELLQTHADVTTKLKVVRHFGVGEEEERSDPAARFQKVPGQHQLLGFYLGLDVLSFLVAARAEFEVDEYG